MSGRAASGGVLGPPRGRALLNAPPGTWVSPGAPSYKMGRWVHEETIAESPEPPAARQSAGDSFARERSHTPSPRGHGHKVAPLKKEMMPPAEERFLEKVSTPRGFDKATWDVEVPGKHAQQEDAMAWARIRTPSPESRYEESEPAAWARIRTPSPEDRYEYKLQPGPDAYALLPEKFKEASLAGKFSDPADGQSTPRERGKGASWAAPTAPGRWVNCAQRLRTPSPKLTRYRGGGGSFRSSGAGPLAGQPSVPPGELAVPPVPVQAHMSAAAKAQPTRSIPPPPQAPPSFTRDRSKPTTAMQSGRQQGGTASASGSASQNAGASNGLPYVLSVGSVGHPFNCKEPCKYVRKSRGCKDGANCDRCHACMGTSRRSYEPKQANQ